MSKFIFAIVGCCCAFCLSGAEGWNRDSGLRAVEGDFTAAFTFRWHGYAPIPEKMDWRNGMIACCRSGYYDGWRVHLHNETEARPVFEIGRKEGSVSVEGPEPVTRGQWHRLAVCWQAADAAKTKGVMRLWLDGRLQAESPADRPAPLLDGSTLKLGYVDFGVGALHLEVSDVACKPRALTTEEIAADAARLQAVRGDARWDRPLLAQVYTRGLARIAQDDAGASARVAYREPCVNASGFQFEAGVQRVSATKAYDGMAGDLILSGAPDGSTELTGEELIPASAFTRLTDDALLNRFPESVRDRVLVAPCKGLSPFASYGVSVRHAAQGLMVFDADGRSLACARWPKAGCRPCTATGDIVRFTERPPALPSGAQFLAYGYWRHLWADAALPAEWKGDGAFALQEAHGYGLGEKPVAAILGVPEVASAPGEWCVVGDRFCLIRPDGPFGGVRIPRLAKPIFRFVNTPRLRLENLTLSGTFGTALEATGCADLELVNVTFRRIGGNGAVIRDCPRVKLVNCRFEDCGHTALQLAGGDRRTLSSGGMVVANGTFTRNGRLQRTYTPSILLEGCGGTVAGCSFADMPSSAMRIEGNDHLVRDCTFDRTVLESDDQGAIDIWGNPTYRGNVFFRNTFRDVGGDDNHGCGRAAIRFDDMISGMAVISNTFVNCAQGNFGAVQMNGGHYNAIVGNTFENCAIGVTGQPWGVKKWSEVLGSDEVKGKRRLAEENPVYALRYPELSRIGTETGVQFLEGNTYRNVPRRFKGLSMDAWLE